VSHVVCEQDAKKAVIRRRHVSLRISYRIACIPRLKHVGDFVSEGNIAGNSSLLRPESFDIYTLRDEKEHLDVVERLTQRRRGKEAFRPDVPAHPRISIRGGKLALLQLYFQRIDANVNFTTLGSRSSYNNVLDQTRVESSKPTPETASHQFHRHCRMAVGQRQFQTSRVEKSHRAI